MKRGKYGDCSRLVGVEPTKEEIAFYEAWAAHNRRVGFRDAVSVVDKKEIDLMWMSREGWPGPWAGRA